MISYEEESNEGNFKKYSAKVDPYSVKITESNFRNESLTGLKCLREKKWRREFRLPLLVSPPFLLCIKVEFIFYQILALADLNPFASSFLKSNYKWSTLSCLIRITVFMVIIAIVVIMTERLTKILSRHPFSPSTITVST